MAFLLFSRLFFAAFGFAFSRRGRRYRTEVNFFTYLTRRLPAFYFHLFFAFHAPLADVTRARLLEIRLKSIIFRSSIYSPLRRVLDPVAQHMPAHRTRHNQTLPYLIEGIVIVIQ